MNHHHHAPELRPFEARLNITYDGRNGDFVEPVPFDASDAELIGWATEAVRAGLLGDARGRVDLRGYVVDRFGATANVPHHRIFVRPKTPFG